MKRPVIILHGYSDDHDSFKPLAAFLQREGFNVVSIYLGQYITLEDTVTIPDLAKAFEAALKTARLPVDQEGSIDLIVHSTGSLVAREWLTRFYLEPRLPCPVAHYLMLAPANFGSPLGHVGKTMLGRIVKGWRTKFESGTQVLSALELASPYTWQLAERDLFGTRSFYQPEICQTAVLVGSKPYQTGLRQLVDKNGSDGTVYVCTANLNASALNVVFRHSDEKPIVRTRRPTHKPIAFGVFPDRDHSSITRPDKGNESLGSFVIEFLKSAGPSDYASFAERCSGLTEITLPDKPGSEVEKIFHTYQNLVARVRDDLGNPVNDYFLEFYERPQTPRDKTRVDELMVHIHGEVLESVHVCGTDRSHRSLIFDLTDLRTTLASGKELMFSLSAAPLSSLIGFAAGAANDISEMPVDFGDNRGFWRANQTLLADLTIERTQDPKTLRLHRAK